MQFVSSAHLWCSAASHNVKHVRLRKDVSVDHGEDHASFNIHFSTNIFLSFAYILSE